MAARDMPEGEYRQRHANLSAAVAARGLDGLLAFSAYMEREGHVLYLTGHRIVFPPWASDDRRNGAGFSSCLVVPGQGIHLFAAFQTDRATVADTVAAIVETMDLNTALIGALRRQYGPGGPARLGITGSDVLNVKAYRALHDAFPGTEWVVADDLLVSLRMVKSDYEQQCLRAAARTADAGIRAAWEAGVAGVSEKTVARAVAAACQDAGADHVARIRLRTGADVLVSGRWPLATDRTIAPGDLVYMDLLGWVGHYAFDVARTWSAGPTDDVRENLLTQSANLLERTIHAIRPGATGDEVARSVGASYQGTPWFERYEPMGHGIGIECVENPWIMPGSSIPLAAGMVLSLEPEFVIPGKAKGQQEDMVLVTPTGVERLTESPWLPA